MTAPLFLLVGSAFVVSIGEMTCSSRHEAHAVQSRRVGSAAVAENLIALLRIELPKRHATFLRVAGSHRPLVSARPTQWQGRSLRYFPAAAAAPTAATSLPAAGSRKTGRIQVAVDGPSWCELGSGHSRPLRLGTSPRLAG